ncbi:MAG: cytochrome c biogenesis protein ResB [Candidatus Omnitrophota bacterium]|nr:cytochrome c biogenesis protein ResB [Candidatus Omnitrophota bacterium]
MNKLLPIVSSLKITCACVFWLFVLTFWGTVAQVGHGLYDAQERFFYSWFFRPQYFLPLPGAQLTMWVLFFNLMASAWTRFKGMQDIRSWGLKLTHFGILLYLAAAFFTFISTEESYLNLQEGQGSNLSSSYSQWEVAYWTDLGSTRHVKAVDIGKVQAGQKMPFETGDFQLKLVQYHPNCAAFTKALPPDGQQPLNGSGITLLQPRPVIKEKESNIAGGLFELIAMGQTQPLLLYGGEAAPTPVVINGQTYFMVLQPKKYPLPVTIQLKEFRVEFYPRTETAKSYESTVIVLKDQIQRQTRIYMNNPLTEKDYTLFQASYATGPTGIRSSTLAVVRNSARGWPYVACFVVLAGLILHFLVQAFVRKRPS